MHSLPHIAAVLSCLFLLSTAEAGWKPLPQFGLGEAGDFAVLLLGKPSSEAEGNSKLDLSAVAVHGDVGVGPWGQFDFQGPATINGDLYLDPTVRQTNILSYAGTITGLRFWDRDLSLPVAQAISASERNGGLPPTLTFRKVLDSVTIQGNGGLNVILIENLDYSASKAEAPLELTLKGGPDDVFILNIPGKFVLGPSARVKSPDPGRVLINLLPGTTPVAMGSGSYAGGTLLAVDRKMGPMKGASGPIIGAMLKEISLVGGAALNPPDPGRYPIAVIGADCLVAVDATVQLDGTASTSPDPLRVLSFEWTLLMTPPGSTAVLLPSAEAERPFFEADQAGDYLVELVVRDGLQVSDPVRLLITAAEPGSEADLRLVGTDFPDPVIRKQELTYTLTVENQGPGATNDIELKASLIGDMVEGSAVVDNRACSITAGEVACTLGPLADGDRHLVRVTLLPKREGNFFLQAVANSPGTLDPDPTNNQWEEKTKVLQR